MTCLPAPATVDLAKEHGLAGRDFGFADDEAMFAAISWRRLLDSRDLAALRARLEASPALACDDMLGWCDHKRGVRPLHYIAMLRFDAGRLGLTGPLPGTGDVARLLIAFGAPVDGRPDYPETPLITAASYGDAEVASALIEAGATIDGLASSQSGGVPGGSALRHAAVFGMTAVVDVLVAAGATPMGIGDAAATGDLGDWLERSPELMHRVRALALAAVHDRVAVIDQLLDAGTPIDATDDVYGTHALRDAAEHGSAAAVKRLIERGADPNLTGSQGLTPLDLGRQHPDVVALLGPLTSAP